MTKRFSARNRMFTGGDVAPEIVPGSSSTSYSSTPTTAAKVTDRLRDNGIVVLVVLCLFVIIFIVAYIVRMFKQAALKTADLLPKVVAMDSRTNLPIIVPAEKMSATTRGQEYAYSFWVYISDVNQNSVSNKVLFSRGATSNSGLFPNTVSPVVMLDGRSNAMYFALSTTAAKGSNSANCIAGEANRALNCSSQDPTYLSIKVDYVPLQRWVHFALVCQDNVATLYMDGDVYSIVSTNDLPLAGSSKSRPLLKGTSGDVIIGDPVNPMNGFLAKLQFFNYAVSQRQVQSMYRAGPVNKSSLAFLGIGNYGLRSPIYNMEDAAT